jgi:hypothetical protein
MKSAHNPFAPPVTIQTRFLVSPRTRTKEPNRKGRLARFVAKSNLATAFLAPSDAHLTKRPSIFQPGGVRTTQMQFFGQIQRQFFRSLRFHDHAVLLEDGPMFFVEFLIRQAFFIGSLAYIQYSSLLR